MKDWRQSFSMVAVFVVLTGIAYPLLIISISSSFFSDRAQGSPLIKNGQVLGSAMIAQNFSSDKYFWPRPSSIDYNPLPSASLDLPPTSRKLKELYEARLKKIIETHYVKDKSIIPQELLFSSGSGLDPHISRQAAFFQFERVAKARGFNSESNRKKLKDLVLEHIEPRHLRLLGKTRINVLRLNMALDELVLEEGL